MFICVRYRTGCRMLGSNIFLCCPDEMDSMEYEEAEGTADWSTDHWKSRTTTKTKPGIIFPTCKNYRDTFAQWRLCACRRPRRVAVWILRWSWKNPTGWKGLGIPDIIVCNYYSTVYIIYDINLHYVYTIYILRIPLVNEFACLNMFDWTRSELWRFPRYARYARYSPTFRDSFQFKEFKKVSFQDGLGFQCIWSFATHQPPSPAHVSIHCYLPFWWGPIEIDSDWVVDHITNPKFPVGMSRLSRLPGHKKWPALDFWEMGRMSFLFFLVVMHQDARLLPLFGNGTLMTS